MSERQPTKFNAANQTTKQDLQCVLPVNYKERNKQSYFTAQQPQKLQSQQTRLQSSHVACKMDITVAATGHLAVLLFYTDSDRAKVHHPSNTHLLEWEQTKPLSIKDEMEPRRMKKGLEERSHFWRLISTRNIITNKGLRKCSQSHLTSANSTLHISLYWT